MFTVELYAKIRHAVMIDGLSRREAAKRFGVHRNTITKMLSFSVPPGYRRRERPTSKKLGPYLAWIDAILEGDSQVHKKQRHTAHRIFERLRDEQGFTGGYTIVRGYVAQAMLRRREMFVPLSHRPGHAQADFGEADGYIGGKKVRFHYFCMDLPHSDGCFVKAYPAETAVIRGIELPPDLFDRVLPHELDRYRRRVAAEAPYELRRHPEAARLTWLSAFVHLRGRALTDDLVDILIETIHCIRARAERRVDRELLDDLKRVAGKQNLLFDLAGAALEKPDGTVREVVFPVVGEQT